MISGDRLDSLAATDRFHGELGLDSGLWVWRLQIGVSPLQGRYPASKVNDGDFLEKPAHVSVDAIGLGSKH